MSLTLAREETNGNVLHQQRYNTSIFYVVAQRNASPETNRRRFIHDAMRLESEVVRSAAAAVFICDWLQRQTRVRSRKEASVSADWICSTHALCTCIHIPYHYFSAWPVRLFSVYPPCNRLNRWVGFSVFLNIHAVQQITQQGRRHGCSHNTFRLVIWLLMAWASCISSRFYK